MSKCKHNNISYEMQTVQHKIHNKWCTSKQRGG